MKGCLIFSVLSFDYRDFANLILHTKTSLFVSIKVQGNLQYKEPITRTTNMNCKVQGSGQQQRTPILGSDQKLLFIKTAVQECKIHWFGHEVGLFNKTCSHKHSTPSIACKIHKTTQPMQKGVFHSLFPPKNLAIIIQVSSIYSVSLKT